MTIAPAVPVRELPIDRLYEASRAPELVRVPRLTFIQIDGHGDPNTSTEYRDAIQALFGLSYTLRFAIKKEIGLTYRVGPLEGLWWADDMAECASGQKATWRWTAMISQPDAVTFDRFERARDEVRRKKGLAALDSARLAGFDEGLAAQIMYLGPYSDEGPTIERLHAFIHELGYTFDGRREASRALPRRSSPECPREAADDHPSAGRAILSADAVGAGGRRRGPRSTRSIGASTRVGSPSRKVR